MIGFLTFTFSDFLTAIHVIFVIAFWLLMPLVVLILVHTFLSALSLMRYAKHLGLTASKYRFLGVFRASLDSAWRRVEFNDKFGGYWHGLGDWCYYDQKQRKYVYGIFTKKKTGEQ